MHPGAALRMLVACWIMYGIAIIVIFMRLLAKLRISARLGLDDGLMILSLVHSTILNILNIKSYEGRYPAFCFSVSIQLA